METSTGFPRWLIKPRTKRTSVQDRVTVLWKRCLGWQRRGRCIRYHEFAQTLFDREHTSNPYCLHAIVSLNAAKSPCPGSPSVSYRQVSRARVHAAHDPVVPTVDVVLCRVASRVLDQTPPNQPLRIVTEVQSNTGQKRRGSFAGTFAVYRNTGRVHTD